MILEIDDFLKPISVDSICGEYLKYDPIYDHIKELRRADDADLSQGIWAHDLKKADWYSVIDSCSDVLKMRSKDVQIAIWLLEALISIHGIDGYIIGIDLVLKICETYWDAMHPMINVQSASVTARAAPFYFLCEKIPDRILFTALTDDDTDAGVAYNLADWMLARHNMKIKNHDGLSMRKLQKSVLSTNLDFFKQLEENVNTAIVSTHALDDFLTKKMGNDAPSFRVILTYFDDIKQVNKKNTQTKESLVQKQLEEKKRKENEENIQQPSDEPNNTNAEQTEDPTIDDAYKALSDIAMFLSTNQPQSPATILIKLATSIGNKSFQEMLELDSKNGSKIMNSISELYSAFFSNKDPQKENIPLPPSATKK